MVKVIVVGGTGSGVGKTSLSVGLMAAFRRSGLEVQAFKVGPDYLDPLHHEAATGRPSVNLDGWMLGKDENLRTFYQYAAGADIAIVEGVMGLFDGRDGRTEDGSTAQMAKWLGAAVVLVMDCWSVARSAAAMVKGYQEFDSALNLGGILMNKVGGPAHTQWLQEAVESAGVTTRFLGGVPKSDGVFVKERYLGLHSPGDAGFPSDYAAKLATLVEQFVDLEAVLELAASAQVPDCPQRIPLQIKDARRVQVAVAKDAAFSFYYQENLDLLREAGADLVFFSPLRDQLPEGISGIYFGGGYPERHAEELSANRGLMAAIKAFAMAGGVVYAECGGLIYLSQSIQPSEDKPYSMVGVFPFRTMMSKSKLKMGYVEVTTDASCNLFPSGSVARGHVHHYSEILQERVVGGIMGSIEEGDGWVSGYSAKMQFPGAKSVPEGYVRENVLASYVHLHLASAPQLAVSILDRCR